MNNTSFRSPGPRPGPSLRIVGVTANYGMVPGIIAGMIVGIIVGEVPMPTIDKWGFFVPQFSTVFSQGASLGRILQCSPWVD